MESSNPNHLPLEVALAIEENENNPMPAKCEDVQPADNLVARLTAVRERLFWLQSLWATTLSTDVAFEAERYRRLFGDLAAQLRAIDPAAVDRLVAGHEALLLTELNPPMEKPKLPLKFQQWFELSGEIQGWRRDAPKIHPPGYIADGLQNFV